MNRQHKEDVIASLKQNFEQNKASFLVEYKGLSVAQLSVLRKQLRSHKSSLQVAKVTLMKKAVDQTKQLKEMGVLFGNQTALVFVPEDAPAVAKILIDFSKKNEQLRIVGGCFDAAIIKQEAVQQLASLPSREVLLAQVCGTLQAPIAGLNRVLAMQMMKLLFALQQVAKQKENTK